MFYEFNGIKPVVHESSFVHPQANVTGNVTIGKDCYIGPHATLRGDWGEIIIEDGCNVQESCTVHMFPNKPTILRKGAHIGHGAVIHGGDIGENVLVGMNAVVMDGVVIERNSIIGALCFVPAEMHIKERSLVVGNPAKVIKEVSDEMLHWKTQGTALYQKLPSDCKKTLKECEPLRRKAPYKPEQSINFKPWKETK